MVAGDVGFIGFGELLHAEPSLNRQEDGEPRKQREGELANKCHGTTPLRDGKTARNVERCCLRPIVGTGPV